jgi:MinD-like ATPase involved in chromosome partitioning or flagellar assembly
VPLVLYKPAHPASVAYQQLAETLMHG